MRKDMAKVIVERPRLGGAGNTFRGRRGELKSRLNECIRNDNFDDLHKRESYRHWASARLGYDRKELNENLNPLVRYLRSQVGRNWDQVYSEMCEVMDTRSACQAHIWQHAKDDVETNTFIGDDGEVWFASSYCYRWCEDRDWHRPISDSVAVVYVDPRDKTLQLVPKKNRYRYHRPVHEYVEIDKYRQAHRIGEHWFLIELADAPKPYWKPWSAKERTRLAEEIAKDRSSPYGRYSAYNSEINSYKRSADGRWIYPQHHDVAYSAILATWRGEYDRTGKDNYAYRFDSMRVADIYGRNNVYAKSRKQMNHAELRRWVFPKFPAPSCEPEVSK